MSISLPPPALSFPFIDLTIDSCHWRGLRLIEEGSLPLPKFPSHLQAPLGFKRPGCRRDDGWVMASFMCLWEWTRLASACSWTSNRLCWTLSCWCAYLWSMSQSFLFPWISASSPEKKTWNWWRWRFRTSTAQSSSWTGKATSCFYTSSSMLWIYPYSLMFSSYPRVAEWY